MADDIVVIDSNEEEIAVVDEGRTVVSEENAQIAEEAAEQARHWAGFAEQQATIAIDKAADASTAAQSASEDAATASTAATDVNVVAVGTNLRTTNTIGTVAGISSDVSAVSSIASDVTTVSSNTTNINKVATDINRVKLVADDISSVHTVAIDISNVIDVADNKTNIDAVASDLTNINAVAADLTNINNASTYAVEAKQWAIGDPTEPSAGSAKYWAQQAAQGQVQSDWNQTDNTQKDYIKNKPDYGSSLSYSSNSLQLLDQSGNALGSAVIIQSSPDIDNKSITKNSLQELQTIGVINQNATTTAIKTWTGTKAQYDALKNNIRYYAWGGDSYYTTVAPDSIQTSDKLYNSSGVELAYTIDDVSYNSTLNQYEMTIIEDSSGLYYELIRNSLTTHYDITDIDNNTLYNITDDESSITTALNTLVQTTQAAINTMLNSIYPVGSIYITVSNDNPATLLGLGTWNKVSEGRVLQGSDSGHSAGSTIAAGLPNITGVLGNLAATSTSSAGATSSGALYWTHPTDYQNDRRGSSGAYGYDPAIDASRSSSIYGQSNTVQPPAFVVNIWERIA